MKTKTEFRSVDQPHDQAQSAMRISRLLSFFVLLLPLHTFAEVYDVSTTVELREALASAATNGEDDSILLADGTYRTTDDDGGPFEYLSNEGYGIKLEGADPSLVILSGENVDQVFRHKLTSNTSGTLLLKNISILNGTNIAAGGEYGGGVSSDGDVEVHNCVFTNNHAARAPTGPFSFQRTYGGGISASSVSAFDSSFSSNSADEGGGAIHSANIRIANTTFSENSSSNYGGAINATGSNPAVRLIENSSFFNNMAVYGGALNIHDASILNSVFKGNFSRNGGAIHGGSRSRSDLTIRNSVFEQNETPSISGGGRNLLLNNIFNKNGSDDQVNTINVVFYGFDTSTLLNNIFIDSNTDEEIRAYVVMILDNNYVDTSRVNADFIGNNNIFENIELGMTDLPNGNYRLASGSDLIDQGRSSYEGVVFPDTDLAGNPRISGTSIDIGPYEYDGEAPPDSDGDGINDNIDNCPTVFNEDQADFDSDGEGDACDSDDDDDGTNDDEDAFPYDDAESLDTDGDGVGNNEDYDDDADGILDSFDNAPLLVNVIVVDTDNDGVIDSVDAYPNDPTKQFSGSSDLDGDGFSNDEEIDYCTNPFDKSSQPELGGLSLPLIQVMIEQ